MVSSSSHPTVRIITDSSSDISSVQMASWNIDILTLPVFFGEEAHRDLSCKRFYELLAQADTLPKTAQITPFEFEEVLTPYVEAGDEIVILPISKEMSGTYQSALAAKAQFPDAVIHVIDTQNVTFALALLVNIAVILRDQGLNADAIAQQLHALTGRVRLYAVIGDLKYLRMGGRLSSTGAAVGTLLNIKPLIAIQHGKVVGIGKARGMKAGYQSVVTLAAQDGLDPAYPVCFGHSNIPDGMQELIRAAADLELEQPLTFDIGPVVGTHAGPGATGIAFIAREHSRN